MLQHPTCIFVIHALIAVSCIEGACDCKNTKAGLDYEGTISKTISGYTCQEWAAQTPNRHDKNDVSKYPNAVNNEANYCRNPNQKGKGPWCYTIKPGVRLEYCDIPLCSTCEPLDHCDPDPCQNGGVCTSGSNSYSCACPAHCSGPTCGSCGIPNTGPFPGTIKPVNVGGHTINVFTETDSEGHTWMVLMRRYDGKVDFADKKWADYKKGFGDLSTEFWLGNDNMHLLTSNNKHYIVHFDMKSFDGERRYAEYSDFAIDSEADGYKLRLGEYSGDAGNAMEGVNGNLRNQPFTTSDRDNDNYSGNCAVLYHGGWWYDHCFYNKFTGDYGKIVPYATGIHWQKWLSFTTGLEYVDIKIRERDTPQYPGHVETVTARSHSFEVLVDTDNTGKDWIVLMRRYNGFVDFVDRTWADYKSGFGDLSAEFWLGNDNMNYLTNNGKNHIVRFDMTSFSGETRYAEYDNFAIESEAEGYKLRLGAYSGNAGDAMQGANGNLRFRKFTTSDRDNDNYSGNCAVLYNGGWWYDHCFYNKFTGDYGPTVPYATGIHWQKWLPFTTGLKYVDIKIAEASSPYTRNTKSVSVSGHTFDVLVDTDGGGNHWIVLMRRYDGFVDFASRKWDDYKSGFGDLSTEFWLGNDKMHYLTDSGKNYVVRFNMKSFTGESRYAEYDNFAIGAESDGYQLRLGAYSGTAGDAMQGTNGNLRFRKFTTSDRDNDNHSGGNCAVLYHGGWWHDKCFYNKFTGDYGPTVPYATGIHWQKWLPFTTGLKYVDISIRERDSSPYPGRVDTVSVNGHSFNVLKDTDSSGDEWTVLMRRYDGFVDFANRKWADYKNGFGDFSTEFWLGNDKMHDLTTSGNYKVRFDMKSFTGQTRYAEYNAFSIGSESTNYRLTLGDYSGNAGDAMEGVNGNLRNQPFTTSDRDNDNYSGNCAVLYNGGWWYDHCFYNKFTGHYGPIVPYATGIHWQKWLSFTTGLKYVDIKIRPN